MADKKINVNKLNRTNKKISGNINNIIDGLYTSVFGSDKNNDIGNLNNIFNSIVKDSLGELNSRTDGDVTSFITKLVSSSEKSNAYYNKQIEDIFNMKTNQIEMFLSDAYKNNLLKQADLHEVATQLNELREAILITRDSITSSDIIDGRMSRSLLFKNTPSDTDNYITVVEQMEKRFKLQQKIKNFIIPRTLEYGEYYGYVIPYSKIFQDFINDKRKNNFNYSTYEAASIFESVNDKDIMDLYNKLSADCKQDMDIVFKESNTIANKTKEIKNMFQSVLENISVSNEPIPLNILDEGGQSIDMYMTENNIDILNGKIFTEKKSSNKFISNIDGAGVMKALNKNNTEKKNEFDDIRDCYIKLIDPMHLIPVEIMDYTIGYYYIQETDITPLTGALTTTLYYNIYDKPQKEQSLINAIANQIVKSFDKKFLNDNIKFKNLIANAIQYYNLNERKIRFQYIPKEYIVPFKINEDENGHGTSIIEPALFYAKLYLMLLLFKMLSIVAYSNDTRVHYIKQSGIDKNISNKIQEIARKMQSRQINILDMFSYTTLVNKIGNGSDRYVPVGKSGERAMETEILSGQDVQLNTDLMEMLRSAYISSTGVPAVIMNYINEADYAKTLELANSRYQGRIVSNQLDFNLSITEFYKRIMMYATSIPEQFIDSFEFSFSSPKYSNYNITSDLINSFSTLSDFLVSLLFGDDISTPEKISLVQNFKLELAKEKLPIIGFDRIVEIMKECQINNVKDIAKNKATSTNVVQDEYTDQ